MGNQSLLRTHFVEPQPLAAQDLHLLNLTHMKWEPAKARGTPPGPANMHTSDLMPNRLMFVFRGGDGSQYLNDLHVVPFSRCKFLTL